MGLHTTLYGEMVDEAEFRQYIAAMIGEDDADLLSDFVWTASESASTVYLTHLAQISRTLAMNGVEVVASILAEAKKPTGEHTDQVALAEFARKLVENVAIAIGEYPPDQRAKATGKLWKTLLRRMRKKLASMYPDAKSETVDKALAIACVWDKKEETFGIEPMKLVDAMRSPPSA